MNRMSLFATSSLALLTALAPLACAGAAPIEPDVEERADGISAMPLRVGEGYDRENLRATDDCFETVGREEISSPGGPTPISVRRVSDFSDIKKSLGMSVEGSYQVGLARGEASARFAKSSRTTELTSTVLVEALVTTGSKRINLPKLRADAEAIADPRTFRMRCGTHYVDQVVLGGRLTLAMRFAFGRRETRESFEAKAKAQTSSGALSAMVSSLSEAERRETSLELAYDIVGGDPKSLASLFNGIDVVRCDLSNLDACERILQGAIDYAARSFPESVQRRPTILDFSITPYVGKTFDPLPPAIESRRVASLRELERQQYDYTRADALIRTRGPYYPAPRRQELEGIRALLERNMTRLESNINRCYTPDQQSTSCADLAGTGLEGYDPARLDPGPSPLPSMVRVSPSTFEVTVPPGLKTRFDFAYSATWENSVIVTDKRTNEELHRSNNYFNGANKILGASTMAQTYVVHTQHKAGKPKASLPWYDSDCIDRSDGRNGFQLKIGCDDSPHKAYANVITTITTYE